VAHGWNTQAKVWRLGVAAAAAVCLLPGTADCRREDIERLLPQVTLRPFPLLD